MFQAGLIEHVHLSVDIESSNFWRSNMNRIRLGNNVIFVSSYAAGKPTHKHKAETSVWLVCPLLSQKNQTSYFVGHLFFPDFPDCD